jgi:hypothetical protein
MSMSGFAVEALRTRRRELRHGWRGGALDLVDGIAQLARRPARRVMRAHSWSWWHWAEAHNAVVIRVIEDHLAASGSYNAWYTGDLDGSVRR